MTYYFQWRSTRAHKFHTPGLDKATVAQRAEATADECSLTSRMWAPFSDRLKSDSEHCEISLFISTYFLIGYDYNSSAFLKFSIRQTAKETGRDDSSEWLRLGLPKPSMIVQPVTTADGHGADWPL